MPLPWRGLYHIDTLLLLLAASVIARCTQTFKGQAFGACRPFPCISARVPVGINALTPLVPYNKVGRRPRD
jgi:hypothetical protein